jgi:predicted alpha/beta hydrolase family esterase
MRSQLEGRGCKTHAPLYPKPEDPVFEEWKAKFEEDLKSVWNGTDDIFMVGHSLGGYFVLRLLGESAEAPWTKSLKGVVLVAPTSMKRPERRRFYSEEVQWENIKRLGVKIIVLYSLDDPNVSREHQELIIQRLCHCKGFEYREWDEFGHFFHTEPQPPVRDAIMQFA